LTITRYRHLFPTRRSSDLSQTPEHLEQPLNEIVDVKGIKAQGNRLSFHAVEQVELLTSELDLSELEEPTAAVAPPATPTDPATQEKSSKNKPEESTDEISLEITEPNDIQLDQNGQLGLFGKKDDNN